MVVVVAVEQAVVLVVTGALLAEALLNSAELVSVLVLVVVSDAVSLSV
jgi:hypothetical protein